MRKALVILATIVACGCSSTYRAGYDINCHLDNAAPRVIAQEIAGELVKETNGSVILREENSRALKYLIAAPNGTQDAHPSKVSQATLNVGEYSGRIVVGIDRKGEEGDVETRRLRDIIERVLSRNKCTSWTFNQQVTTFDLK